jgi:hypothetical protein
VDRDGDEHNDDGYLEGDKSDCDVDGGETDDSTAGLRKRKAKPTQQPMHKRRRSLRNRVAPVVRSNDSPVMSMDGEPAPQSVRLRSNAPSPSAGTFTTHTHSCFSITHIHHSQ